VTHQRRALGDIAHGGRAECAPLVVGRMVGGRHQGIAAAGADTHTVYIDASYFAEKQGMLLPMLQFLSHDASINI
jgi:hypothetical protein